MDIVQTFVILTLCHFLFDFPLQGDFQAKFKSPTVNEESNPIWGWVMLSHSCCHAIPVYLVTGGNLVAVGFMIFTHFLIDWMKCENRITFNHDQLLHIGIISIISILVPSPFFQNANYLSVFGS